MRIARIIPLLLLLAPLAACDAPEGDGVINILDEDEVNPDPSGGNTDEGDEGESGDGPEPSAFEPTPERVDAIFVYVAAVGERTGDAGDTLTTQTQTRSCGWEYYACVSWCMSNQFDSECFGFCADNFCD